MSDFKKTLLVSASNFYISPYIKKYDEIMGELGCRYDIAYWNRHDMVETPPKNSSKVFRFDSPLSNMLPKWRKLLKFIQFGSFVKKTVKSEKYERVLIVNPSLAVLMPFFLRFSFGGKFMVDIRDYWCEGNPLVFLLEKVLYKKAALKIVSSPDYAKFLPKSEYVVMHNEVHIPVHEIESFRGRAKGADKISVGQIGFIKFQDENEKFLLNFKNDERFKLKFIGYNSESLCGFMRKNKIANLDLGGSFPAEKTLDLYREIDVINNLYGRGTAVEHALSNKLYYAAKLGYPIIVTPHTYMSEITARYSLGIDVDTLDPSSPDKLYNYYAGLDWKAFYENCDRFLADVKRDQEIVTAKISEFLR